MLRLGTLPDGSRGFDCNEPLTLATARKFVDAGYLFVVRYVARVSRQAHDLSAPELMNVLLAGLSVMVVQHVARPGWMASMDLGTAYGRQAAIEARACGYPKGGTLWCDLEEVGNDAGHVIAYGNAWYDQVAGNGYEPGLYFGYGDVLTGVQLYRDLKFRRYWSAYNANAEQYPIVRGAQMRQRSYPRLERRVPGVSFEYQEDIIQADKLGGSPILLIPY